MAQGSPRLRSATSADGGSAKEPMRKRVLVVDDDLDARRIFEEYLAGYGYDTSIAKNGTEALALLTGGIPMDLVLLDLMMPGMTGYAFLRAMKMLARPLRELPVAIVTAAPSPFVPEAEAVFTKPVAMLDLLSFIDRRIGPGKSWPQRKGE